MKYETKSITLKDGRQALLRAPCAGDAAEMVAYLQKACGETDYLARYPEEMEYTVKGETPYLQNTLEDPNSLMIVCTVEGKIAGNCQIIFMNSMKTRHRAAVMIGLLKEYWGVGIGTALFAEMIETARQREGVCQLELEMIEGNERAFALYRKMGFEVMGEHPDAFRLKDGSSRKAIFMRKPL